MTAIANLCTTTIGIKLMVADTKSKNTLVDSEARRIELEALPTVTQDRMAVKEQTHKRTHLRAYTHP
jgi:hypothetical protein